MSLTCAKCGKPLNLCGCNDIDERMRDLKNNPSVLFKMCLKCDKHYLRCGCEDPEWGTSHDGLSLEDAMNKPTLADFISSRYATKH